MNVPLFEQLYRDSMIEEDALEHIKEYDKNAALSVHWDLLTLLYAGIFLLTTALGIIIYENIDSIGHVAITLIIAAGTLGCFFYCFKKSSGFSYQQIKSPNMWFDYVLLLGCLLMLVLVGYLQFQFQVFGTRLGLATFLPMVILFFAAYYFDHIGVLSLAITNLAAWVGITITPLHLLQRNDFRSNDIIYSGIGLGLVLIAAGFLSARKKIKAHFCFTYKNFGTHLLFVATLAAVMVFSRYYLLWFLFLSAISYMQFALAVKEQSFYFLVSAAIYFYIGLSYVVIKMLFSINSGGEGVFYLALLYIIISGGALVMLLTRYNKILKEHVSVQ